MDKSKTITKKGYENTEQNDEAKEQKQDLISEKGIVLYFAISIFLYLS